MIASVRYPEPGFGRRSRRPEAILLLCYYDPQGISTVPENVAYFQIGSQFSVSVLNLFEHRQSTEGLELSPALNLQKFSAVVIHNSVSYDVENLRSLDRSLNLPLDQFEGVKVLMKQDENFRSEEMARYMGEKAFDVVFTCLPADAVERVYPASVVGNLRFVRMLTGYVTPSMRAMSFASMNRAIDIGYRGSIQPLSFGRLAFEKRKIGDDVVAYLDGRGLAIDISSRWEDRIGGSGWFQFLANCKATLGAESGASLFDLNGDLDERCKKAEAHLGPFQQNHAYAEAYLEFLQDLEGNIYYNQVSPRHFEAISTNTLQMLYPGRYSGILQPRRHYFPLERDCSNLDEGVDLLLDEVRRREMVSCAYEEVLLNQQYWIETFAETMDKEIASALESKNQLKPILFSTKKAENNVLLICAHEPQIDPRLGWVANYAPKSLKIHQCGVLPRSSNSVHHETPSDSLYEAFPLVDYSVDMWANWRRLVGDDVNGNAALGEVLFLQEALQLPENAFAEMVGAPYGHPRLSDFRWYLCHFLNTCATILDACINKHGIHAIINVDLDTILPALILKAVYKVPLFYDAHEYWGESDINQLEFERLFWKSFERRLVPKANYRQIVSPGLAALLSSEYNCHFNILPNCQPIDPDLNLVTPENKKESQNFPSGSCVFLFQGGFAQGRGLERLIEAWGHVDEGAYLLLRGPDNEWKSQLIRQARKSGMLDKRIFFPPPVDEADLVTAAARADVGIVPYPPTTLNYEHCSPNKLSQYMAAGIPILANRTDFVAELVTKGDCGVVVDFGRQHELAEAINKLAANPEMRLRYAKAGKEFYLAEFNWQLVSQDFYLEVEKLISLPPATLSSSTIESGFYFHDPKPKVVTLDDHKSLRCSRAIRQYQRPLWLYLYRNLLKVWLLVPQSVRPLIKKILGRA